MSRASLAEHRAPQPRPVRVPRRAICAWFGLSRERARLVAHAAEGRLQAAQETQVPEEVRLEHPHLLLMLEHCERAASAAAAGKTGRHAEHTGAARDEEELFRSVLRQLGWSLPVRP